MAPLASLATSTSARPSSTASAPEKCTPVRAITSPSGAETRCRNHDPPTSGWKPIASSGMASREVSETMRVLDPCSSPKPPPMQIPPPQTNMGFGKVCMK